MGKADVKFTYDEDEDRLEEDESSDSSDEDGHEDKKEEVVPREHYENLKKALQETRGKSKAEIESLRQRVEAYENALTELQSSVRKDEVEDILEGLEDDDLVTVAGVKKVMETQNKKLKDREAVLEQTVAAIAAGFAELVFKQTHSDFDDVTAPFKDLLKNKKFVADLLSEGIQEAPKKFYEYCKKASEPEEEGQKSSLPSDLGENIKPIKKPGTMDAKSKAESSKTDTSRLTIVEKRRLLKKKKDVDLDKLWLDLVGKQ